MVRHVVAFVVCSVAALLAAPPAQAEEGDYSAWQTLINLVSPPGPDNRVTAAQRLHLLNSSEVRARIERGELLGRLARLAGGRRPEFVRLLYLSLLSRYPETEEAAAAEAWLGGAGRDPREAAFDLAWALVNSREFLYRH